jgi:hypothetical protein
MLGKKQELRSALTRRSGIRLAATPRYHGGAARSEDGGTVNCNTCGAGGKGEIAVKIIGRDAAGITRCHRLECGHAWHLASATTDTRSPVEIADPVYCTCREIATVNNLLAEGRQHAAFGNDLPEDVFRHWLEQVLQALDGIPAESGAPSLVRSAATTAKSQTSGLSKKLADLNKLLERAIKAVS